MATFSEKIKLTEKTVAAAKPTTKKSKSGLPCAKFYLDTELRGFGLSVSAPSARNPEGVKSYFVMRRVREKQERYVFQRASDITVAEARARAAKLLSQMTDGVSLIEQERIKRIEAKKTEARGVTLKQALDLNEGTLRAKGRAPRTMSGYRDLIEKYLTEWLDRSLADISRAEVRKRHVDIAHEIARGKHINKKPATARRLRGDKFGTRTANNVMRAFRAVYNRALREHPELPVNPIINVDWNKEQRRTGRIPAVGVKEWYDRVMALTNQVRRDYLLFALFSGLRKENAAEAMLSHIDWDRRTLHVPKPKSQKPFDLPLSDFMVELLRARVKDNKKLAPGSPWVFPAARGKGHIVEVRLEGGSRSAKLAQKRKKIEAGENHYTTHDYRRTFTSVATSLGIPREHRQLLVNHATPKSDVHGGYVIPELEELRAHMQQISNRLQALCQPPRPGKSSVVSIRKKAKQAA